MPFFHQLYLVGLLLVLYFSIGAGLAYIRRRADDADIAWGLGFIVAAWSSYGLGPHSLYGLVVSLLVTIWGGRLSLQIYLRNRQKKEDARYVDLFKNSKKSFFYFVFVHVFLLQGIILFILSLPIIYINAHRGAFSYLFFWALVLWGLGWCLESIADYQLYRFKQNPQNKGRFLDQGVWALSRHPNYLGEIVQWWALWLMCLNIEGGVFFIFSPLFITFLLLFVSGIPMLEKKFEKRAGYAAYKRSVPLLVSANLVNGIIYTLFWYYSLKFAAEGMIRYSYAAFCLAFIAQLTLFFLADRKSLRLAFPLVLWALFLGWIQESALIYFDLIAYPNGFKEPPLWLLLFYPVFALLLNSLLSFLNQSLFLTVIIGSVGGVVTYVAGSYLGAAVILSPLFYFVIPMSWAIVLLLMVLYNRKLIKTYRTLTSHQFLSKKITVFFDGRCPICSREMQTLKKREALGPVEYAAPKNQEELSQWTDQFTFKQSMKVIHAIDDQDHVYRGVDVLAYLYAKTNLLALAILIKAPGFHALFRLLYRVWAYFRPRIKK